MGETKEGASSEEMYNHLKAAGKLDPSYDGKEFGELTAAQIYGLKEVHHKHAVSGGAPSDGEPVTPVQPKKKKGLFKKDDPE